MNVCVLEVGGLAKSLKPGCPFGTHRVLSPKGVLPQAAWRIDNTPEVYDNEILVEVKTLNIDAASFKEILSGLNPDFDEKAQEEYVAGVIQDIVLRRGKMHNPTTGSGGMLLGTIKKFGPKVEGREGAKMGDLICTLVSLSLTPLKIDRVKKVYLDRDQVDIEGTAVIFETGPFAVIPEDLGEKLSLAVLDVAGAPVQTERLVKPGDTVLVLGAGGKSGLLCSLVAKEKAGAEGIVIGLAHSEASKKRAEDLGAADIILVGDARDAVGTMEKVLAATHGKGVDLTINCVNIAGTEMASILSTRQGGKVYFFSMATSFTAAALGAEGVGRDVELIIGNGYAQDHARKSLDLVRRNQKLRQIFESMFLG